MPRERSRFRIKRGKDGERKCKFSRVEISRDRKREAREPCLSKIGVLPPRRETIVESVSFSLENRSLADTFASPRLTAAFGGGQAARYLTFHPSPTPASTISTMRHDKVLAESRSVSPNFIPNFPLFPCVEDKIIFDVGKCRIAGGEIDSRSRGATGKAGFVETILFGIIR